MGVNMKIYGIWYGVGDIGYRFGFRFRNLNFEFDNYDIEICKGLWFF